MLLRYAVRQALLLGTTGSGDYHLTLLDWPFLSLSGCIVRYHASGSWTGVMPVQLASPTPLDRMQDARGRAQIQVGEVLKDRLGVGYACWPRAGTERGGGGRP